MIKRRFARTNKRKYMSQITAAEARERAIRRVTKRMLARRASIPQVQVKRRSKQKRTRSYHDATDTESSIDPTARYHMAESTRHWDNVLEWIYIHSEDVAVKVSRTHYSRIPQSDLFQDFIPKLKDHLLTRLFGRAYDGDEVEYSDTERNNVEIVDNRMYDHKTLRVNYTTYDLRRQQDVISPEFHPDAMVLSCEDGEDTHPYWYARVIKIFHLLVRHHSFGYQSEPAEPQRMDVLWVRWFGINMDARGGLSKKRLHGVSFIPWDEGEAFGFLDPAQVIRGVHLIPNFSRGWTERRLPPSMTRRAEDEDKDWDSFYVNL